MANANKIKYGLRHVYYAKATDDGTGVLTYDTPVAIPGAVNLTLSQEGEDNPFYADDVVYWRNPSNNGYSGSLEIALVPDSFYTDILGFVIDNDGVMLESADQKTSEFALMFEFQGDVSATRHLLYRCSVTRPDVAGATKEAAIEPQTETLNISAMPRISDFAVKQRCPADSAAYDTWFDAVHEPALSESASNGDEGGETGDENLGA